MPRKPNEIPTVPWRVYIEVPLAAEVDLLLLDPMREKVKYAARGKLISELLRKWVEEQRREPSPQPPESK